jgi:hypothetical protein
MLADTPLAVDPALVQLALANWNKLRWQFCEGRRHASEQEDEIGHLLYSMHQKPRFFWYDARKGSWDIIGDLERYGDVMSSNDRTQITPTIKLMERLKAWVERKLGGVPA